MYNTIITHFCHFVYNRLEVINKNEIRGDNKTELNMRSNIWVHKGAKTK